MRLEHKKDYTKITVSRANYYNNLAYYREHYKDITPKRTARQEKQSHLYVKLGRLSMLQSTLGNWQRNHIMPVDVNIAASKVLMHIAHEILDVQTEMKPFKEETYVPF